MVKIPQGPYTYINLYQMPLNGRNYEFYTLVSQDGFVAWMPDNEQQHVNIGYNGTKGPTRLESVSQWDIARMLFEVILFQTKKQIPLEDIVSRHGQLIDKALEDFKAHEAKVLV